MRLLFNNLNLGVLNDERVKWKRSACEYEIRNVDGTDYLIIEWKSGDYRYGGYDTNYYVFVRG